MLIGDGPAIGMNNQITEGKILKVGVGTGQLARIAVGVDWQLYNRMLHPRKLNRGGRGGGGWQAVTAIANHNFALVLQHDLMMLIHTQSADQHDAWLVFATCFAIHDLGVTAQSVAWIDGP